MTMSPCEHISLMQILTYLLLLLTALRIVDEGGDIVVLGRHLGKDGLRGERGKGRERGERGGREREREGVCVLSMNSKNKSTKLSVPELVPAEILKSHDSSENRQSSYFSSES
jgi:hypothetical protein